MKLLKIILGLSMILGFSAQTWAAMDVTSTASRSFIRVTLTGTGSV